MKSKFRVIGAGVWGLAFSDYLLELGHTVDVFCRDIALNKKNLDGVKLSELTDENIRPITSLNNYDAKDSINILAVNSAGFRDILDKYKNYLGMSNEIVSLTKGIDHQKSTLFHEVIEEYFGPNVEYGLISGPSFAKDLSERKNISVSFASHHTGLSKTMAEATKSSCFSMNPTSKLVHIEIAGVLKNVAAILSGMSDKLFGIGVHTNRIIKIACDESLEMANQGDANKPSQLAYSDRENIISLPGFIGDMILTCKQYKSRNYQFGSLISDDRVTIRQAKEDIGTVEGYDCCITLIEKSTFSCGSLIKVLYDILHCDSRERVEILSDFLQS